MSLVSVKSDAELIKDVLAGSSSASSLLFKRYNQRLYRFVRTKVGNVTAVEEVTQDALIAAFKYLHTFKGDSSFYTWLCKIAIRKMCNQKPTSLKTNAELVERTTPETLMVEKQSITSIVEIMKQLPSKQQSALFYKIYDRMAYLEIGEKLGCSPAYAKNLVYEAKKTIRNQLTEEHNEIKSNTGT